MLDLGRLLPANDHEFPYSLVRQFRPEYMLYRVAKDLPPLSPDAFTGFGVPKDNAPVEDAIKHFFNEYLPMFVKEHLQTQDWSTWKPSDTPLNTLFHKHGVNMRYLGRVRGLVPQEDRYATLRSILLREIALRAMKSIVLHRWRNNSHQGNDVFVFTADQVLHRVNKKFPGVSLSAADEDTLKHLSNAADVINAPVRSLVPLLPDLCRAEETDLVIAPDFPTKDQAEKRLLEELRLRERTVGSLSPVLLATMRLLLNLYQLWHEHDAADTLRKGTDLIDRMTAIADQDPIKHCTVYYDCAEFWRSTGHYNKAIPLFEKSVGDAANDVGGAGDLEVGGSCNNVANMYYAQGQYDKAQPLYERAIALTEPKWPRHRNLADSQQGLANIYVMQQKYDLAEPLYKKALEIREEALGETHPNVSHSLYSLAFFYNIQRKYNQAEPLFERALKLRLETLGDQHPDVLMSMHGVAGLRRLQHRYEEALEMFNRCLKLREEVMGPGHPDVASSLDGIGEVYMDTNKPDEALPVWDRSYRLREAAGVSHPVQIAGSYLAVASTLMGLRRWDDAEKLLTRALNICQKSEPFWQAGITTAQNRLAEVKRQRGR